MEKSYEKISARECQKMLNLEKDDAGFKTLLNNRRWTCDSKGTVRFVSENKNSQNSDVPSEELARMAISYAKETEKIV